jgi:serine/threonine-protein kinase SRPK3
MAEGSSGKSSSVVYDSEEESSKDYRAGGYHPVHIGDLFLDRYVIVQKLGWGHFSTVWLCLDQKFHTYVAMKIQKSAPNYTEAAYDEIDILIRVAKNYKHPLWVQSLAQYYPSDPAHSEIVKQGAASQYTFVVQFLNSFIHVGENGKHVCMVFEVLGVNLLEVIKRFNYKGIPLPLCRVIGKQVLIGLDYLHRVCGIIHTDLKPENVLLELTQEQIQTVLMHGKLVPQGKKMPTPITELPAVPSEPQIQPEMTEEQRKEEEKRQKKREKKQKYKQRKKEEAKKMQEEAIPGAEESKKKKKKHKKKKKKTQATALPEEIKASEGLGSSDEDAIPIEAAALEDSEPQGPVLKTAISLGSADVDEGIRVKIADLGNACWLDNHFSTEIQTRQYRSPEVILGVSYNYTADVWSFACMLFELITGDFLFEPKSGSAFDKDDDHLAQMIETLGELPKNFALSGRNSRNFFRSDGTLRKIPELRYWPLRQVLTEKYHIKDSEAKPLSSFLLPMLVFRPEARASAQQCLNHPWLSMPANYDYRMTSEESKSLEADQLRKIEEKSERMMSRNEESSPEMASQEGEPEGTDADDECPRTDSEDESGSDRAEEPADLVCDTDYHKRMNDFRKSIKAPIV